MADVDIVEVIAEEIYKARNGRGCRAWGSLPNSHKEPYRLDARAALSALTAKGFAVVSREELDRIDMELGNYINATIDAGQRGDRDFVRLRTDYEEAHANGLFAPTPPTQTGEK